MGDLSEWINLCWKPLNWPPSWAFPCPHTLHLCFTLSPGCKQVKQHWQTAHCALQTFLLCMFCSHYQEPAIGSEFVAELRGRCGGEGCITNLLSQKRKTAVTSRKENDWNEANQQSVMNSFSLRLYSPPPQRKTKHNKTRAHRHITGVGSKATAGFLGDPRLIPAIPPDVEFS